MFNHEPLRITARLRTGVMSDNFLPLDAILHYQTYRHAYGPQDVTLPGAANQAQGEPPMPLERATVNDWWMWCCSFAQWGPHSDGQSFWVKRFDQQYAGLVDFGKRSGKVMIQKGRYKAYNMPVQYRHALWVRWYATGDAEAVRALLSDVTHIGKKTAQGFGRVISWTVEPWPEQWWLYDGHGRLMRAIPDPAGVLYGIRPSYWLARHQTRCRLPDV